MQPGPQSPHLCLSWFQAVPVVDVNSHYVRGSSVGQTTAFYRSACVWVKAKGEPRSNAETTCVTLLHGRGFPKALDTRWPGSRSSTAIQFARSPSHQTSDGLKIQNHDKYKNKKRAGKWRRSIKANLKRWKQFFKHMNSGWISPGKKKKRQLGINRTFFFPSHDTF